MGRAGKRDRDSPRGLGAGAIGGAILATLILGSCGGDGAQTGSANRPAVGAGNPAGKACSSVESSPKAIEDAVADAEPGTTVCLADGAYGRLSLDASPEEPGVTIRAERPGRAMLSGATLQGSNLTLSRFEIDGEVTVEPGSTGMIVSHNRISGGYFGVIAGPTSSTPVNPTSRSPATGSSGPSARTRSGSTATTTPATPTPTGS